MSLKNKKNKKNKNKNKSPNFFLQKYTVVTPLGGALEGGGRK